jgi:OPA family glycerol-3-phosphate transporter-like MFS transporter
VEFFRGFFAAQNPLTRAGGSVFMPRRFFWRKPPMNFSALIFDHPNLVVGLFLAAIIFLYFRNNPLGHTRWFMLRRFINWFPRGMTYSFLYMGRYNLNVSKNALGSLMTKEEFGTIFAVGTIVYGFSFLVNGPLVDKIGGKKGIIIAAIGSSIANILLGVLTYFVVMGRLKVNMVVAYSVLYGVNMYFQSYGAVSIIKVKAYWFHVRERGVFGAIFGALISIGVYFAFDWGQRIVDLTKANSTGGWFHDLLQKIFATNVLVNGKSVDATWAVFFIPAVVILFWMLLDWWLIKDTPEEADFPPFDTADASSGQMHVELSTLDLLKKVFASKLMLLIALVGLTSGVFRNGVTQWYFVFAAEVKQPGAEFFEAHWGFLLCVFGIVGGFFGGWVSDHLYQSRRAPPAAFLCALVLVLSLVMAGILFSSPLGLGWAAVGVVMASVGITSLMSGTAATDFGGRKATATCSGIVDGCTYLGSGLQSYFIGHLTPAEHADAAQTFLMLPRDWHWWPLFMLPFAVIGLAAAIRLWNQLPEATRKFLARTE